MSKRSNFGTYKKGMWYLPSYWGCPEWVQRLADKGELGFWHGPKITNTIGWNHPYDLSNQEHTQKKLQRYFDRNTLWESHGVYYFSNNPKFLTYQAVEDLHLQVEAYIFLNEDDAMNREYEAVAENMWKVLEDALPELLEKQKQAIYNELYTFYDDLRYETYVSPTRVKEIAWVLGFLSDAQFDDWNLDTLNDLNLAVGDPIFHQKSITYPILGVKRSYASKQKIYLDYRQNEGKLTLYRRKN